MRTTTIAIALVAALTLVGLTGCGGESAAEPASTNDKSVTVKDVKLPEGHPPVALDAPDGAGGCPALEKTAKDAGCGTTCGDSCSADEKPADGCGDSCGGCDEKTKKTGADN